MKETPIVRRCRLAASERDARLFRNNVGVLRDVRGNYVTYGLAPGSSDLVGFVPYTILPEDVGARVAVFTAIECKAEEDLTEEQVAFLKVVREAGGIAGEVRGRDAALQLGAVIDRWRPLP